MSTFLPRLMTLLALSALAATAEEKPSSLDPGSRSAEPLVDLSTYAPEIVIELRYATARNFTKTPVYPRNARCYVRKSVADRLKKAQAWLSKTAPRGTRLKIWDGWRPEWAHLKLWKAFPNKEFLGDPKRGGSLHTWGVCVDVTLCNAEGRDLAMPTDFDTFSPQAKTFYSGSDTLVRKNLRILQGAMTHGGFLVVYDEWWHFVARDWKAYAAIDVSITGSEVPE